MATHTADLEALMARLETVERGNRRLKLAGAIVLLLAATGLLMAQGFPTGRTVEAQAFILRDASGAERAAWHLSPDGGAALTFFDQTGRSRAQMTVDRDGRGARDASIRPARKRSSHTEGGPGWSALPDAYRSGRAESRHVEGRTEWIAGAGVLRPDRKVARRVICRA